MLTPSLPRAVGDALAEFGIGAAVMLTLSLPRAVGDALTPQGVSVPVCGANNRPEGDPPLREAEKGFRADDNRPYGRGSLIPRPFPHPDP